MLHTALNGFLRELDERVASAQADMKKHVPQRKNRIQSTLLDSVPPPTFQKWTVSKEWLKGIYMYVYSKNH